ncbi:MAG: hypothetical protein ABIQ44_10835 [Chloroflexia bacterium]
MQVTIASTDSGGGFNFGNFDFFAPLNTLAGLGLSFPWVFEQIKKRRSKKLPEKETTGAD